MTNNYDSPYLIVLGIAQDGGFPHVGCQGECCRSAWNDVTLQRKVACLGIIDSLSGQSWMIDATPDFSHQWHTLQNQHTKPNPPSLNGIFLTHGHVGHYTGLIHCEKAVMNTRDVPVFAMPQMMQLLSFHLPWKSLVDQRNIVLKPLQDHIPIQINDRITVMPFLVPHRDEFTETVGFIIAGPHKKVLYIPDIDRWEELTEIDHLVENADTIFVDGTFYNANELKGRDIRQVPHPIIETSLSHFSYLSDTKKSQFYFIHLNHTNPCLNENSIEYKTVQDCGFRIAREGQIVTL